MLTWSVVLRIEEVFSFCFSNSFVVDIGDSDNAFLFFFHSYMRFCFDQTCMFVR